MSIKELLEVSTIDKDWSQLNINSLTVANLTVRDTLSGSSRFTLQFGGSMLVQPKYCNLSGDVNSVCIAGQTAQNIGWIPKNCILKTVCYATLAGTPTTNIHIIKGINIEDSHPLGAVISGIYDVNIPFIKGDALFVQFTGPDAGASTIILYFE